MPTLEEWQEKYRRESPFPFNPESGYQRIFDPEKGFMTFEIHAGPAFFIQEMCGDMKHWMSVARSEAKARGIKLILGVSKRNFKAVSRLLKVTFVGHLFATEV